MKSATLTAILLIALVTSISISIFFIYGQHATIPSGHQTVINHLQITVTISGTVYTLAPVFTGIGDVPVMTYQIIHEPPYPVFTTGTAYPHSSWHYVNRVGNIEAFVCVVGPDNSGNKYAVEISRVTGGKLTVTYGTDVFLMPDVTDWTKVNVGYLAFNVQT